MSLSKKKYSFHRKRSDHKQSYNLDPSLNCFENENEIQDNSEPNFGEKVKIDDLICKTNSNNNNLNKEMISFIPLMRPNINYKINDEKKEKKNIESNPNLQYLINKNEEENFDFINTLLKLKGISIESTKGYKSSKNINIIKNIGEENEDIYIPMSSKANNEIFINNQNKYNKSIPSNCSTSTSKINTINNNCHINQNEEQENNKNVNMATFSTNEINNNIDNTSNVNIIKNIKKIDPNALLKELITLDNKESKKINSFYTHSNKDTISSECNTNNTAKKYIKKETFSESISSKELYSNIKETEKNYNKNNIKIDEVKNSEQNKKIKNRALIPINRVKNNKSFYKKNMNQNKNIFENNNEKLSISIENKILKKKSIKRIPHNKKQIYELKNNINYNNKIDTKEKQSKSKSKNNHILATDIKSHKRENSKIENIKTEIKKEQKGKKIQNFKNNELKYNNISLINHEVNINNKKDNIIKKINQNLTNEIKHESNNNEKKEKLNIRKKEELKGNNELIKEIELKEIKSNYINGKKLINDNKVNYIIKNPKKENSIFDIQFNSERKITKIFKIKDKIKTEISPNRINNISALDPRNKSNKNIQKYNKIINNLNSYVIIAKNRNFISPHPKIKNKKFIDNSNKANDDEIFSKNHENSHYNFSFNSISINLNNDNIINNYNKKKEIIKKDNDVKKSSKLNCNDEEDNLNKTIDMNDEEFCENEIGEIKTMENKDNSKNNKIIKKEKKTKSSKFAEIFLFDNEENEKGEEKGERKGEDIGQCNAKENNDKLNENNENKSKDNNE